MPKVYLSDKERKNAKIRGTIAGYMKINNVRQIDLADIWGISQPAAAYKLKTGHITLVELAQAQRVLKIETDDLVKMLGGTR